MRGEVIKEPTGEAFQPYSAKWPVLITHEQGMAVVNAPTEGIEDGKYIVDQLLQLTREGYASDHMLALEAQDKVGKRMQGMGRFSRAAFDQTEAESIRRNIETNIADVERAQNALEQGDVLPVRDFLLHSINEAIAERQVTYSPLEKRRQSEVAGAWLDALRHITPGEKIEKNLFAPLEASLKRPFVGERALHGVATKWENLPSLVRVAVITAPPFAAGLVAKRIFNL